MLCGRAVAKKLQMTNYNEGRVLLGTLCADAHRMVAITTIFEDECGADVRLEIYNTPSTIWRAEEMCSLYPKGANVAVKQPYFNRGEDGLLMMCVDSPENIEILSLPDGDHAQSVLVAGLVKLRCEGNKCFRDQHWKGAVECYTTCIDLALLRQKIGPQLPASSTIHNEIRDALLVSYSNRAEARLMQSQFGQAVDDCDKALQLVANHVKSLCRKGRALHALGEYNVASQCFKTAQQQWPTANDIKLQYEKSKTLNEQNQQGKFNLSTYFLNNCRPQDVLEVSNYIGPVLIQKSVGRGRGLFVVDNVDIGDILLVDNALAFSSTETTRTKGFNLDLETKDLISEHLVAELISSAVSSPRIMQQLEYLAGDEEKVPPMDLFRINNGSWNKYDVLCNKEQRVEFEQDKIPKIMQNLACNLSAPTPNSSGISKQTEVYGLWALPSFINHSCYPNANCMVVGKAMLIIASRKISVGEEITVSYFDSLQPLEKRERVCSEKGFRCDCKRCILERSVAPSLALILNKAALFLHNSRIISVANPHSEYSESALINLVAKLENAMAALMSEEKQLIRASYFGFYHILFVLRRVHPSLNLGTKLPSMREVADAVQNAVPGHVNSFDLIVSFVAKDQGKDSFPLQKVLEVCRTLIGKQEEGVLKSILESAAAGVFKRRSTGFCCITMLSDSSTLYVIENRARSRKK